MVCGTTNVFPCSLGTEQCQSGSLVCVGNIEPGVEICNGIDDDCDTVVDDNPSDAGGPCNVPIPPPMGATVTDDSSGETGLSTTPERLLRKYSGSSPGCLCAFRQQRRTRVLLGTAISAALEVIVFC